MEWSAMRDTKYCISEFLTYRIQIKIVYVNFSNSSLKYKKFLMTIITSGTAKSMPLVYKRMYNEMV